MNISKTNINDGNSEEARSRAVRKRPVGALAVSGHGRFRGPLPMLNARRGIRGRGLMSASSSCTAATATAMQMRQIPRDHHIMNPLCAANTGRRVSLSFLFLFSLNRFHRLHFAARIALSSAAVPHRFYYSRPHPHAVAPLPRRARPSGT